MNLKNDPCGSEYTWSEQYGYARAGIEVGDHWGFIILPSEEKRIESMPWVWYAPTIRNGTPSESNSWISKRLLAQGIAICGVDVGESYGSPQGCAAFTEYYNYVVREFKLSAKPSMWAQSRGGLMLINWASDNPNRVKCIGGTYPVCDIASYPGLATASSAYRISESELQSKLNEYNPIERLAPLAAHKVPILLMHGDSDSSVPLEANSAELACRYKALGGPIEVVVIEGKGHAEIPEYFESRKMVDFFIEHASIVSRNNVVLPFGQ